MKIKNIRTLPIKRNSIPRLGQRKKQTYEFMIYVNSVLTCNEKLQKN